MIGDCAIENTDLSDKFTSSRLLETLKDNIRGRFLDLTHADVTAFYGFDEMESLSTHYNIPVDDLLNEWNSFLEGVRGQPGRSLPKLTALFFGKREARLGFKARFPLWARLISAAAVMPLSTAEVERVFSQLKLIKTDHRCSLGDETVKRLLQVKLNRSNNRRLSNGYGTINGCFLHDKKETSHQRD
ncbi:LOW QUALITY PROTEIN: hypothetical protein MAR_035009 [Mya arenaria]|uniref:HAT C-terminal dimerisation domain-containing protein n=1 Tax=Mya arenaria TaxID=6604 RepID=A0ABY7EIW4_MYAAR|nr:LOW QUALITY PROTEIN: hypothetical protein MAR_035009 [Mya arenaria]